MKFFKLFSENKVIKLENLHIKPEKDIQKIFECHLETFFKVKLIATEFKIGDKRIDTVGIMETSDGVVPVIFEYKKNSSPMHVLQAVGYDEILKDRKSDFLLAIIKRFGQTSEKYNNVDFDSTKIICVARKFEGEAKTQAKRDSSEIILVEYDMYEDNLITLKLTTYPAGDSDIKVSKNKKSKNVSQSEKVHDVVSQKNDKKDFLSTSNLKKLAKSSVEVQNLNKILENFILGLDNVEKYEMEYYTKFTKSGKIFCAIQFLKKKVLVFIKDKNKKLDEVNGFIRDVTDIGHYCTPANIEITFKDETQFEEVKRLIKLSYDNF
ncbi:hypothetical protein DB313_00445 [Borrelia turcica IST7]|uniref:DUF5655 domain-containing protein n=2 Tax=Borrelia turcica TaxID=229155 RepID=A0A386PM21_9SPIR|nr:hypothetical protein DB313_00445 [Borrelia turcica IST7]